MSNHINTIRRIDQVTDCIPVVSTLKNGSIFLYQLAHKVNKTANPVSNSIKDDIKIVTLSKESWLMFISSFPVIGNVAAFFFHLCLSQATGKKIIQNAIDKTSYGVSKHGMEITQLLLARIPNARKSSIRELANSAMGKNKLDILKSIIIQHKKERWLTENLFKKAQSKDIRKVIIDNVELDEFLVRNFLLVLNQQKDTNDEINDLINKFPTFERPFDLIYDVITKTKIESTEGDTINYKGNDGTAIVERVIDQISKETEIDSLSSLITKEVLRDKLGMKELIQDFLAKK